MLSVVRSGVANVPFLKWLYISSLTFAKATPANFVQTKGFWCALEVTMYSSIAAIKSATLRRMPRRMRVAGSSWNHHSTSFSQVIVPFSL
jgi:hypothetical protein